MTSQENILKIHNFVRELNAGENASIYRYIASDYFNYSPMVEEPKADDVYFSLFNDLKAAFSNLKIDILDLQPENDLLKGQVTLSGKQDGALWGAPPSNNSLSWTMNVLIRPIAGKFALSFEDISVPEILGQLRQIDLIPPPDQMDKPPKYPVVIPEIISKVLFTGQVADKPCAHLDKIQVTEPHSDVCEDCVAQGDIWPALRMCLYCGYIGCCDTSKNKHMKQHYEQTGHPLFRSIRLDEGWVWCYEDNAYFSKRVLEKYIKS